MTALPQGWRTTRLDEVADTALGKMLDRGRTRGHREVPYLRNVNVQWGRVDLDDLLTMEIAEDELERFAVAPGDLLVCEGGEIGRNAIWPGRSEYLAYQKALHRIRPHADLEPRYLSHLLRRYADDGTLASVATGSTIAHLPQQRLRALPVPLPPLDEQRRIVAVLEDHLSRLDAADAYRTSALDRGAALERAVVDDRIGRATEGLATVNASALVESKDGLGIGPFGSSLTVSDYTSEGVPLVFVRDVRQDMHGWPTRFVSPQKASELKQHQASAGDVLITKMGDPPGETCVFRSPEAAIITADVIRWRPSAYLVPTYLAYALRTSSVRRQMARITNGVAQKKVSLQRFRTGIQLAVPDRTTQDQAAGDIEAALISLQRTRAQSNQLRMRSSVLRRALLTAAFTGRLTGRSSDMDVAEELADAGMTS